MIVKVQLPTVDVPPPPASEAFLEGSQPPRPMVKAKPIKTPEPTASDPEIEAGKSPRGD